MHNRCASVILRVAAIAAVVASTAGITVSARGQPGVDAVAAEIAQQLRAAVGTLGSAPLSPCRQTPIALYYQGSTFTDALFRATRTGHSPIEISLPATAEGAVPPPVADALNRLQSGGGRVAMREVRADQSLGSVLAWSGAAVGALITAAVHRIVGAALDQWASAGLARYNAEIRFRRGPAGERLIHEVVLQCSTR